MTLFPKPPILKKIDITKSPLVKEGFGDEEKVEVYPSTPDWDRRRKASGFLLSIFVMALVVASVGVLGGVMLYHQYAFDSRLQRFQGFCTIPIDDSQEGVLIEPHFRVMPFNWPGEREPEAQVLSAVEDPRDAILDHMLRELFEVDSDVERVILPNTDPPTTLIHDFRANASGIVEEGRCFIMDLDPEYVLPPAVFVMSARNGGGDWDVSKVSTFMHAMLPPIKDLGRFGSHIAHTCKERVSYMLKRDNKIIKKRSTETPHLVQFSGRHVQELHVDNLAELLQYEAENAPPAEVQ